MAGTQNYENQDNNTQVISSVYNNAPKGPPKKLQVNHYEPLRHNQEYEDIEQPRAGPRDGSTGPPYYNIKPNKDGRHGFDNKDGRHGFDNKDGRHGFDNKDGRHGFGNKDGRHGFDNKDGRHGFDNRAAEINVLGDGYEVPIKRKTEGQTQIHVESF